jgi:hypothetical protein
MKVYAVVFSNYEPQEVDSLWFTRALAQAKADELGHEWNVSERIVHGAPPPPVVGVPPDEFLREAAAPESKLRSKVKHVIFRAMAKSLNGARGSVASEATREVFELLGASGRQQNGPLVDVVSSGPPTRTMAEILSDPPRLSLSAATPTPDESAPGAPCVAGATPQPEAFSVPACGVCGYPVQHCDYWTDRNGVCKCSGGRERASAPATSLGGFEAGDYDGIQGAINDAMGTHAAPSRTPARPAPETPRKCPMGCGEVHGSKSGEGGR